MVRSVTVRVSEFALEALVSEAHGSEPAAVELARAVRLYLNDKDSDRPGWAYPAFLAAEETGGVELELDIDEDLLRALEVEAARQGVSVSRMAAHAALYYVAELDAGHLTQRILDDLEEKSS